MTVLFINADSRLFPLADRSVHMIVTSQPYWGLRDYDVDGQIGLEKTIEEYIAVMLEVGREMWRVLRDDGTLWMNIGDSYAGSWGNYHPTGKGGQREKSTERYDRRAYADKGFLPPTANVPGLKPKDLCGIPWEIALAFRRAGWYLRRDIIWHKPNPMPESATDRPTTSHEYIFLFSKSQRYYYDGEAVKEKANPEGSHKRGNGKGKLKISPYGKQSLKTLETPASGRNRRSVWKIATTPYKEAHFATFPPALPEICIKAGTSERGCCPVCGAGWVRVIESKPATSKDCPKTQAAHEARGGTGKPVGTVGKSGSGRKEGYSITTGWAPSCKCWQTLPVPDLPRTRNDRKRRHQDLSNDWRFRAYCYAGETIPAIVLDPFIGSGTTALVARKLRRDAVGLDLSAEYLTMARRRLSLDKRDAWENGTGRGGDRAIGKVRDLPLFKELL